MFLDLVLTSCSFHVGHCLKIWHMVCAPASMAGPIGKIMFIPLENSVSSNMLKQPQVINHDWRVINPWLTSDQQPNVGLPLGYFVNPWRARCHGQDGQASNCQGHGAHDFRNIQACVLPYMYKCVCVIMLYLHLILLYFLTLQLSEGCARKQTLLYIYITLCFSILLIYITRYFTYKTYAAYAFVRTLITEAVRMWRIYDSQPQRVFHLIFGGKKAPKKQFAFDLFGFHENFGGV